MTTDRWSSVYAERERLLRLARARTLNEAEAEDCVSEAMLRCVEFENLDEERLAAFLTSVTLRLCADQHRARARLQRVGGRLAGGCHEPGPEENVCDRAEAAWLAERVFELPAHQQKVVAARAEGLSCADAASKLGLSVDAVKSAVARARLAVRSAVASSWSLLPAVAGRSRAATFAAGGAVAGVTIGGLIVAIQPAPPGVAAGPRPPSVERHETRVIRDVALPQPAPPTATVPAAPRRTPRPDPVPPPAPPPTERPPPEDPLAPPCDEDETRDPAGVCRNDNGLGFPEQVVHCLTNPRTEPPLLCDPEGDDQ